MLYAKLCSVRADAVHALFSEQLRDFFFGFVQWAPRAVPYFRSSGSQTHKHTPTQILRIRGRVDVLKSQLAAEFTVYNQYRTDF